MNRLKIYVLSALILTLISPKVLRADEGMWMIHAINQALEKKMQDRGLELSAGEIYNADAEGATISDAILSLDFGCTGSIISDKGLVITNHHCAYSDVHKLSTDENNYLEQGFWAMTDDEEIHIKGKSIYFLKNVIDITDEVESYISEFQKKGEKVGLRRLTGVFEKKYSKETGKTAWFASMWSGSKYYIALYDVYKDIRLVAAPPVSMAAYGGDVDNWEWPQHKCDFAMYRIYTSKDGQPSEYSEDNVPLNPKKKLNISLEGYKPGDYAMVIGYPGRTDRYSSSFEVDYRLNVELPISNKLRGEQMSIINKWMDTCPKVRLKYSDYYFGLSNVQEYNVGEVKCFTRFDVVEKKQELEKELQEWIMSDPQRAEKWGTTLERLENTYENIAQTEKSKSYYRETLIRGTRISRTVYKLNTLKRDALKKGGIIQHRRIDGGGPSTQELDFCENTEIIGLDYDAIKKQLLGEYDKFELKVEKDLFFYSVKEFYDNVDSRYFGPYQKELKRRYTDGCIGQFHSEDLAEYLWENSFLTCETKLNKFINEPHTIDEYHSDPIFRFFQDISIVDFNSVTDDIEGDMNIYEQGKVYTQALYQMREDKGIVQYPDANSTMRITYGTVGGLKPHDGVITSWRSTSKGILEKYNPEAYDYAISPNLRNMIKDEAWGNWNTSSEMYINFLTDNDITGGNSGSPVLNSKGEIIGLAFDGNKESLAGSAAYVDPYNKCVNVDIRYILWTIDKYAGMKHIMEELDL